MNNGQRLVNAFIGAADGIRGSNIPFARTSLGTAMQIHAVQNDGFVDSTGNTDGLRRDLVDNNQGSDAFRHIFFQAGAEVGNLINDLAGRYQNSTNVDQSLNDPSESRRLEGETELRGDVAGREVGAAINDYLDGDISRDELEVVLIDILLEPQAPVPTDENTNPTCL